MKIGFMQGRLLKSENKKFIQYFPSKNWQQEIFLAKKNHLGLMEWTANLENLNKNPVYNQKLIKKTKNILKINKIIVESLTCDFFMQKPFFKLKKSGSYFYLKVLKKVIINAQLLGIRYFVVPLVDNSSIENLDQENFLIKEILKISLVLNRKSKILFELDYPPVKIINFIKKFNNKFGINYDTGNSAALNYDFDAEKIYFRHVKNIHIKDRIINGQSVRLGEGNWDYNKFFKYIKKNYNGNLILQTARSKSDEDLKEVLINKTFIKKYL
jgi:L-ribulose-5-phosphate 3-epimerase UlaE